MQDVFILRSLTNNICRLYFQIKSYSKVQVDINFGHSSITKTYYFCLGELWCCKGSGKTKGREFRIHNFWVLLDFMIRRKKELKMNQISSLVDEEIVMWLAEIRNKGCRVVSGSRWCVWFGHIDLDVLSRERLKINLKLNLTWKKSFDSKTKLKRREFREWNSYMWTSLKMKQLWISCLMISGENPDCRGIKIQWEERKAWEKMLTDLPEKSGKSCRDKQGRQQD